ncbi:hypothetical protein CBI38_35300 (plasmid) [Rhodococcus oxybenzonivorans]|uniref:Uncharacterized protein n=1 Tax=Rhodococcus oxybenzonivorans TaxID=1990687 RepID=A0A2S2C756_9NOCA|nr:hypothetical protein CBI38_35300 [Rhodococcus oxybenzonivorans]
MVPDWECSSTSIFFRAAPRSRLISSENAAPALGLVLLLARVVLAGPQARRKAMWTLPNVSSTSWRSPSL